MDIPKNSLIGWTVLVVDDDPKSLEIMRLLLRYYGVNIYTANNGKEGLDMATKLRPQFIISDLSMPVMDGWQMLIALKQETSLASIPVIALTAHTMSGDKERALEAGFQNYLTKPLNPITFMDELLKLLSGIDLFADLLKIQQPQEKKV